MRRIAWLGTAAALTLAGCTDSGTARNDTRMLMVSAQPDAGSPPPEATPSAAPTDASPSQLRGQVSALTASVSGLERRITENSVILALATDTLFAFDRAELGPDASENLLKAADAIRAGAAGDISIIGYTDAAGADEYNAILSTRRAQAVADWMGQQAGVRLRRFIVLGRGEANPAAPNTRVDGGDDPEGRARNRRVEIVIPR